MVEEENRDLLTENVSTEQDEVKENDDNPDDNPIARARHAPPAFDGVSEIYRDPPTASPEDVAALRQRFIDDEKHFLDIDASPVFLGEVRVVIDA